MADDDQGAKPENDDAGKTPEPEPKTEDKPLGEAGEKALEAFKERARTAEAENKELKPLAEKARELEEANKSELEKATSQRDALQAERDKAAQENLRLKVALDKSVPADLIDRLRGETQEELEADADKLLSLVKAEPQAPDFDGGARRPAPENREPAEAHNDFLAQVLGLPKT